MIAQLFTKRIYGRARRGVIFYFCGWRMPLALYRPVFFVANLAGYRVHAYRLNETHIANADNKGFLKQLQALTDDVKADALGFEAAGVSFMATFGNSLGSELALAVAKQVPLISAVVLNTVRGSTSEFLWHAPYATDWRAMYEHQGYTEASLYNELRPVEAVERLDKLSGKRVLLYYSSVDKTIPPHNTRLLIKALAAHHIRFKLATNRHLGHFWCSVKNHLFFWTWLSFLRKQERRVRTNS